MISYKVNFPLKQTKNNYDCYYQTNLVEQNFTVTHWPQSTQTNLENNLCGKYLKRFLHGNTFKICIIVEPMGASFLLCNHITKNHQ